MDIRVPGGTDDILVCHAYARRLRLVGQRHAFAQPSRLFFERLALLPRAARSKVGRLPGFARRSACGQDAWGLLDGEGHCRSETPELQRHLGSDNDS